MDRPQRRWGVTLIAITYEDNGYEDVERTKTMGTFNGAAGTYACR